MAAEKSLTTKISDLEKMTDWFYSEDFKLDEATKHYQDALALAKDINENLNKLKNEIEVLTEDFTKSVEN